MGDLWFGIGTHAGSVWFAWAFRELAGPRVLLENEMLSAHAGGHWAGKVQRMMDGDAFHEAFEPYWSHVRAVRDEHAVYVDLNSWAPPCLVPICERMDVARVFFIMRNGVQQLYSITNHSYMWPRVDDDHFLVAGYLRWLWERAGATGKPWEARTLWEKKCELWASTNGLIDALVAEGLPVTVWRLEDLVGEYAWFTSALAALNPDVLAPSASTVQGYQARDVHRKVPGDRTPSNLWARWTPEQRAAFREVCGPGMARWGYEIPEG